MHTSNLSCLFSLNRVLRLAFILFVYLPAFAIGQELTNSEATALAERIVTRAVAPCAGILRLNHTSYPDNEGRFYLALTLNTSCSPGGFKGQRFAVQAGRDPKRTDFGGWWFTFTGSGRDGKMSKSGEEWFRTASIPQAPPMEALGASPNNLSRTAAAARGELTRATAIEILNRDAAAPAITLFEFKPGGFDRAIADGVIHKHFDHPAFPQWSFTPQGLRLVGSHLGENLIMVPFGGQEKRFRFSRGLPQRVTEVTGIADGPTPNTKTVDYFAVYDFPTHMEPLRSYIFNASQGNRIGFQKYDDGWRVAR